MFHYYLKYFKKASKIIVAYSGGVDSQLLLKRLVDELDAENREKLLAVHVHHNLSSNADLWAEHCQETCRDWQVKCEVVYVQVERKSGESLEAQARTVRYLALSKLMEKHDVLLTAHHQDDQAETCLLQFLRGAGVKGLSAMPAVIKFSKGRLIRPFLETSRQEILSHARRLKLSWVEDESNTDTQFRRNFLRQTIIPSLKEKWPKLDKTIGRVAKNCAEASLLLDDLAEIDLSYAEGATSSRISVPAISKLSEIRQKNLIRYWLTRQSFTLPSAAKLNQVLTGVIAARLDRNPSVSWADVVIRRYQEELYALHAFKPRDTKKVYSWDLKQVLELENLGSLHAKPIIGAGLKMNKNSRVTVRFRQGGEICRLSHRPNMTHRLKNLFQEWRIPPWERDRIPLVFVDNQLAIIIGYEVCDGFRARDDEPGFEIRFEQVIQSRFFL